MAHAIKGLLLTICLCLGAVATSEAATTWYAAPNKANSGPCSSGNPCSAKYALQDNPSLANGDTVVMAGGDYVLTAQVFANKRISIEGATSGPRTKLIKTDTIGQAFSYGASGDNDVHITDIDAVVVGSGGALSFFGFSQTGKLVIDRVMGEGRGDYSPGISIGDAEPGGNVSLRNSIGRSLGAHAAGVHVTGPGPPGGSLEMRNVTADARNGNDAYGVRLVGSADYDPPSMTFNCGSVTLVMRNTIARSASGPSLDLKLDGWSPCTAKIESFNSNWRGSSSTYPADTVTSAADQHSQEPLFTNAAAGDYHQLAGSPTIDAATDDGQLGPLSFFGASRVVGAKPDIGADEFVPPGAQDTVKPLGSSLKFSPSSLVPGGGPASITRNKKKPKKKGSTVSYKLSEAATVSFTVQKRVKGRKKGKKCKAGRKKGKKCTIFKSVRGSFSRASVTGANSFHFTGYVNGKKLKRGKYRLTGVPKDAAGNTGATFTSSFSVRRR